MAYENKFGMCSGKGKVSKEARKETQVLWRHAHSDISIVTCSSRYSHNTGKARGRLRNVPATFWSIEGTGRIYGDGVIGHGDVSETPEYPSEGEGSSSCRELARAILKLGDGGTCEGA
ncbi:hypothetical protein Bca101_089847 [Brassica carinata]